LEIKVGENYIISSDEYNWVLKEKKVADPKHHMTKSVESTEKYMPVGYFGKIEHLANSLLQRHLKTSEPNSIEDLINTLHKAENVLKIDIINMTNGEKL
jgi:ACT domain-containing protein